MGITVPYWQKYVVLIPIYLLFPLLQNLCWTVGEYGIYTAI